MTSPEVIFTMCRRTRALPYHILKSLMTKVRLRLTAKGRSQFFNIRISQPAIIYIYTILNKYGKSKRNFGGVFNCYFILVFYNLKAFLIKQFFHSRLLDMKLIVKVNSALRASLAIYHLISNARSWTNC